MSCDKEAEDDAVSYMPLVQYKWEHRVCARISVNEYNTLSESSNKIMFSVHCATPRFHLLYKLKMKFLQKNQDQQLKGLMKGLMQLKLSSQKYLKRLIVHLSYTNHLLMIKLTIQFHILPLVS